MKPTTEQKELTLDDFFKALDEEPKFVEQLSTLVVTGYRREFLNSFLLGKIPQWDGLGMHAVFNAIQRKYGLDLGFCPYYEADFREEFKRAQNTERYTSVEGICWRYVKPEAKCNGQVCDKTRQ